MSKQSETNPHFAQLQDRQGRPLLAAEGPSQPLRSDQRTKEQNGQQKASQPPISSNLWPLKPREGQTSQQPLPQGPKPDRGQYKDGTELGPVVTQPPPTLQTQSRRKKKDRGPDVTKPEGQTPQQQPVRGQDPSAGHKQDGLDRGPVIPPPESKLELQPTQVDQQKRQKKARPTQAAQPESPGPQQQPTQGPRVSPSRPRGLWAPAPRPTKPITWFNAFFCAIFLIIIFLGGLIVLIIYLVYRPRSPHFDIADVTLNAAYIDADSLLNADLSIYANFTNPNKKMGVEFRDSIVDLYYGDTLIATQFIMPFSIAKANSRFANVHMVTSQVKLPPKESQQLQEQIANNAVIFKVKGYFRVRSYLASFLKYSYWLHGHCSFMVTAPPSGVRRATRCKSKH